jgi:hypothetical protein
MHPTLRHALSVTTALVGLLIAPSSLSAATGEVTLSGSTWTGRVDGTTRYTGSSMAGAANACVANMSSGTITIRNSGPTNGTISIKSNITIDGVGVTLSGGGTTGVIYAQNSSNIGAKNIKMASSDWYGIYFRTCQSQNAQNNNGTANLSFRIDNCKGGNGSGLSLANTWSDNSNSHGSHHVETYGIDGITWGTITSTDRTGGNGCLLNFSSNASGTSNNATRACVGCGYAGFRTANTNGKTTLGSAVSTSCGRGYFSVSGSRDCTISTVDIRNSSSHGIWLQTTYNTRINGGTVQSSNPCTVITAGSGNVISATCGSGGGGGGLPAAGTYSLRSRTAGTMLDTLGATTDGANVALWADGSSNNQRWVLSYVSSNVVKLQCVTGSKFLDGMGRTANGSFVGQWAGGSSNNQRWTIIDAGSGYFKLKNVATGLCLDVGASPYANGDVVEQWPDGSSQNQHWQFVAP